MTIESTKKRSDKRKRNSVIQVRVDDLERAAIAQNAVDSASQSIAEFLRNLGLKQRQRSSSGLSREDREAIRQLQIEIRRIGTNVNQIAKAVNERGRSPIGAQITHDEHQKLIGYVRQTYAIVMRKFQA